MVVNTPPRVRHRSRAPDRGVHGCPSARPGARPCAGWGVVGKHRWRTGRVAVRSRAGSPAGAHGCATAQITTAGPSLVRRPPRIQVSSGPQPWVDGTSCGPTGDIVLGVGTTLTPAQV